MMIARKLSIAFFFAALLAAASSESSRADTIRYSCRSTEDTSLTFSIFVDTMTSIAINTWTGECQYCSFCARCPEAPRLRVNISSQFIAWTDTDSPTPVRVNRATGQYQYVDKDTRRWTTSGICRASIASTVPAAPNPNAAPPPNSANPAGCRSLAGTWTRSIMGMSIEAVFNANRTGRLSTDYDFTWSCVGGNSYVIKAEGWEPEKGTLSADGRVLTMRTDVATITYVRKGGR